MSDIFGLKARFNKNNQTQYTLYNLLTEVQTYAEEHPKSTKSQKRSSDGEHEYEYLVRDVRQKCSKLFPSCSLKTLSMEDAEEANPKGLRQMAAKERFDYLNFIYCLCIKEYDWRYCTAQKLSIFDSITEPSTIYSDLYNQLIQEVRINVSAAILTENEKGNYCADLQNTRGITDSPPTCGYYAKSIRYIQEYINRIAYTLVYSYWGGTYRLEDELRLKVQKGRLENLEIDKKMLSDALYVKTRMLKSAKPRFHKLTPWDELYLRLSYARDFCWETDLLAAYRTVHDCSKSKLDELGPKQPNDFKDCILLFINGKIEEVAEPTLEQLESFSISESYLNALEKYVDRNLREITALVFGKNIKDVSRSEKKRIQNRYPRVKKCLQMEYKQYGRVACLPKGRLIALYHAIFIYLKLCDQQRRSSDGNITNSVSKDAEINIKWTDAFNHKDVDPLLTQMICVMNVYIYMQYSIPEYFVYVYLPINIEALETILSCDWRVHPSNIQDFAESTLFLMANYLIPPDMGMATLKSLISTLVKHGWEFSETKETFQNVFLGRLCQVFGITANLIEDGLDVWDRNGECEILLNKYIDGEAIRRYQLVLAIGYDESSKCYYLSDFRRDI